MIPLDGKSGKVVLQRPLCKVIGVVWKGMMNQLHTFNDVCNNESLVSDTETSIAKELADWLISNNVVEHIFGPNLHIEIIKQCQVILNFLAAEGRLSTQHIDCIWAAAQVILKAHIY
ncbi:ubiquitin carboxyl-terminal hydrolase 34-like [Leptonychotes weddellii]|uniref:Ubiquitin carboxyl-terminal hydrolase 34-like n=1 Tax=Leptonychotes weddellii TaxID=9713 RepID=A0A7F8QRX4_LEPWE|nr:ubiquitin carboxyl-terminal hydrolase 34-like [Leptonychotes weddellii]